MLCNNKVEYDMRRNTSMFETTGSNGGNSCDSVLSVYPVIPE